MTSGETVPQGGTPSPVFVSVASTGFSSGVSCLDATVADGCVGIDSKADEGGRRCELGGSSCVKGRVDLDAECTEFAEKDGTPHPGCFLQEWQTQGLCLTGLVRVANAGLKVADFSVICRELARVAGKGVIETQLRVEG